MNLEDTQANKFIGSKPSAQDMFDMLCGKFLGEGCFREVFEFRLDPEYVIKFETRGECFANATEWQIWNRVCEWDSDDKNWFAPCWAISPRGDWLIQKRTKPVATKDLPERVPNCFTDLKDDNWGWLEDRVVCHDYSCHLMVEKAMNGRLKKADWID